MAELATLARPYANAVYNMGRERNQLEGWARQLALLANVVEAPQVRSLVESPAVPDAAKAHRVADVVGAELNEAGRGLVHALAANKRLPLLPEIRRQFDALKADADKTLAVEITAATPLTEDNLERFAAALAQRFEQQVEMTAKVDESLLGGAVIRAGDTVFDGSVRGKLDKLAESLAKA